MAETTEKPLTLIALRHSGTHLIQPIMRRLSNKTVYAPKGNDAVQCTPSEKVVIFLRDPRDTIVSQARYKNAGLVEGKADRRIVRLLKRGDETPVAHMTKWASRWATGAGLIVRFEELTDPATRREQVERIRDYIGGGDVDDAIAYAFGKSVTWTGKHSKWRDWFGPEATKMWKKQNGAHLVALMGYK